MPPELERPCIGDSSLLSSFDFTVEDVYEILAGLDSSKAMGIDGIGPALLKSCALALYEPLFHLFRSSLSSHQIPAEWRIHKITPVFKSGDRACVDNYRPLSLLCTASKVLERLIYDKCIDFLAGSITSVQYGFMRNHSSLQQLLVFYRDIFASSNSQTLNS